MRTYSFSPIYIHATQVIRTINFDLYCIGRLPDITTDIAALLPGELCFLIFKLMSFSWRARALLQTGQICLNYNNYRATRLSRKI